MSEDKKTPKERIEEIKKKRAQSAMEQVKAQIKERQEVEKVEEIVKSSPKKKGFTERQIVVLGSAKDAKAYFVYFNPESEVAYLQKISDTVPGVVPARVRQQQGSLHTLLDHQIKKVKDLRGDNNE